MQRRSFILSTIAATLAPAIARGSTLEDALRLSISQIPGTAAVYARTMENGAPLYAYNADEQFPAASTIKMIIMLTAFLAEEERPGSMHAPVRIRRSDLVGGSPFLASASGGEHYTVAQLLKPMIQLSDNSASNALISHFGFERINAAARATGMQRTQLKRHFLDYSAIVLHHENLTTAHDMGSLLYQLERGSRESLQTCARPESCREMIAIMLGQTDRDKIPRGLPPGIPVANKTGEVDGVRNDAAIVDPFGDSPFVLTVYTKNLGNYAGAVRGINAISTAVYRRVAHTNN